jgi:predicted DNA repair protein MutK
MPGTSLLTLLDDIASVLDDVAILGKLAAKKTAGVLGDDLALNAQQVSGVNPVRELPVVWAVAKGSLLNKAILVPAALAISAFLPVLITPLMVIGGTYLVYEGAEKLAHRFLHSREEDAQHHDALLHAVVDENVDLVAFERDKIKGAIRTDFILSAEIIVLSLGVVDGQPFLQQALVLTGIALAMTVGVYGLVAGIVKLDDAGMHLAERGGMAQALGRGILAIAPWLMKFLSVAGTAAMFLVGGGILVHALPAFAHWLEAAVPEGWTGAVLVAVANGVVGLAVGALVVAIVAAFMRARARPGPAAH